MGRGTDTAVDDCFSKHRSVDVHKLTFSEYCDTNRPFGEETL